MASRYGVPLNREGNSLSSIDSVMPTPETLYSLATMPRPLLRLDQERIQRRLEVAAMAIAQTHSAIVAMEHMVPQVENNSLLAPTDTLQTVAQASFAARHRIKRANIATLS